MRAAKIRSPSPVVPLRPADEARREGVLAEAGEPGPRLLSLLGEGGGRAIDFELRRTRLGDDELAVPEHLAVPAQGDAERRRAAKSDLAEPRRAGRRRGRTCSRRSPEPGGPLKRGSITISTPDRLSFRLRGKNQGRAARASPDELGRRRPRGEPAADPRRLDEARSRAPTSSSSPSSPSRATRPRILLLRPASSGPPRRACTSSQRAPRHRRARRLPHFDRDLYNACAVCADGEVKAVYHKRFLPNYGVFDEYRYFAPGDDLLLLRIGETTVGPTDVRGRLAAGPPATDLALAGAELIANISASPYHVGKEREREDMLITRARDNVCFLAFCNSVGGQDELVFDGHSVVIDDEGACWRGRPGSRRRCCSWTSTRATWSAAG